MRSGLEDWNIGRGLKVALIAQCVIAGLLVIADLNGRLSWPGSDREVPPQGPVEPGDQVRHYEPRVFRPSYVSPTRDPAVPLPSEVPDRLEFSTIEIPDFGAAILLNGRFEAGDAVRFEGFLEGLEADLPAIVLNSPGGVVDEALSIGRVIRDRELDTAVLSGMYCVSSCPYVLAGGVERTVSRNATVGLHQHYFNAPKFLPVYFAVEDIQFGQGQTMRFLVDMGIGAEVMIYSLNTPPQDIYVLVEEELVDTRLATVMID